MDISTLLLDFRITSHCNLGCDLCFRNPGIQDSSLVSARNVIERMHKMGFRRIGFTGGEPTSRADFIDLIEYAKQMGFMTYLSTVGHRFMMDHARLNPVLDWVGMPIDGIDQHVNSEIRSDKISNQHRVIKNILTWLPNNNNRINIKLTTVVSQANVINLVMERSHLEDYIFINFMLKSEYISKAQHDAYMQLWTSINKLLTEPDIIAFIDYPVAHSLMHLDDDEIHGVRPEEFPDEAMKVKWITGWHAEYQHFTDNLPVHLRERIMVCDHPNDIDVFSDKVIQKAMMLRT